MFPSLKDRIKQESQFQLVNIFLLILPPHYWKNITIKNEINKMWKKIGLLTYTIL